MDLIAGFNRDQLVMMDFESCLSSDSWARIVDMFVNIFPMNELGFNNILNTTGHRTPIRNPQKTMGVHIYPDERKTECAL